MKVSKPKETKPLIRVQIFCKTGSHMAGAGLSRSETNRMMYLLGLAFVFPLISVRIMLLSMHMSLAPGIWWGEKSIS